MYFFLKSLKIYDEKFSEHIRYTTAGDINENKFVYMDYFRVVTDINSIRRQSCTADNLQMYLNIFFPLEMYL